MKNLMKLWVFISLVLSLNVQAADKGSTVDKDASTNTMKLRLVLFTPADKSAPEGYQERFKQLVDYTEAFYQKWMNHWGYPCDKPLNIERDESGYPIIMTVKGKYNYDHPGYQKLSGIRKEVVEQAKTQYHIPTENQVWWIIDYPERKRGCRGGGNAKDGGTCFANYIDGEGTVKWGDKLGSGLAEEILLKSLIHEMGHALGLGHIGPREMEDLGNSLMGPINKSYKKKFPGDGRVHLSEAAAAMLWKHPLLAGENNNSLTIPNVDVSQLKVSYDKEKEQFVVEGKLKSDYTAHSVVVSNSLENSRGGYWNKAFVGKVKKDGTFKCIVKEPTKCNGELIIAFCFNNGAISGNGIKLGLNNSGIKKQYHYTEKGFSL